MGEEGLWATCEVPGASAASTVWGRVLGGCVMYRVSTHGHSVPTDAGLMLRVEGLFFERPNASSELLFFFFTQLMPLFILPFPFQKRIEVVQIECHMI